jgi:hypothetical protein
MGASEECLSLHVAIAIANTRAPHSLNRQRFALLTAWLVMLDKAGGDMVPLRFNLWPPKENEAAGIIIHRLS